MPATPKDNFLAGDALFIAPTVHNLSLQDCEKRSRGIEIPVTWLLVIIEIQHLSEIPQPDAWERLASHVGLRWSEPQQTHRHDHRDCHFRRLRAVTSSEDGMW
jgi:hypothetical protein